MTIITLSENIISKISAGEVIERSAYAVKELVENALDAHATIIEIQIEEAGLKRIVVQDNGEGMSREDLEICFLPHTTSKLKDEHELIGIRTLGFRGEALSSIAAIASVTIKSRTKAAAGGTEVVVRNGSIENIAPIGMPTGTIVTVDNLFHTVPARKKFLKTAKTEFRLITEIVMHYALSYPDIHFTLMHNKKSVLDLAPKKDYIDRVKALLGPGIVDQLIPLELEDGYIKLSGFIGKPQSAAKGNQKQFLFVNNRVVSDRLIALAVKESFGTLLPASGTPIFLLSIKLPAEIVDVNVHPRKEQIAFINSKQIFDMVKQSVTETLNENNLTFKLSRFKNENSARLGETTSLSGALLKQTILPWDRTADVGLKPNAHLLQIHQTYIFSQTKEGIVLIDQHGAHERILYEQFVDAFEKQKKTKENYELAKPIPLSLSVTESQVMEEYNNYFTTLGFVIEPFHGTGYVIRSVPLLFKGRNNEKIIKDILSDLVNDTVKSVDDRSQRMLAFLSCRAAVKAGDLLTEKQMKTIYEQLHETKNNTTCPHGRPTSIPITIQELHRLFKRI